MSLFIFKITQINYHFELKSKLIGEHYKVRKSIIK